MMKKNLAEAVRNILESVITIEKGYNFQHLPSYIMEPNPDIEDSYVIRVNFIYTEDMLAMASFIREITCCHINIKDNFNIIIS